MKTYFFAVFLIATALATGCTNEDGDTALEYIEYHVPPGEPRSGTPDNPFDIPRSPTFREQLIDYGLTFDEPGSKLLSMKLDFSGFALLHTEEAHATVQAYLTENKIDWSVRDADTEIERP